MGIRKCKHPGKCPGVCEKKTVWTSQEIRTMFEKFSYIKQVGILMDALGYMQQYNGRSETDCIALAIGYDNFEGDGTYTKRETKSYGSNN